MAQVLVAQLKDFFFEKIRYYEQYSSEATDEALSELMASILDVDVSAKADKIVPAFAGNFAGLDANGNLTDSGKRASSFSLSSHNHDGRYLRLDDDTTYDATAETGHRFTFHVLGEAPFDIDNASGDTLPVVTHLNADKLDGNDASAFALKSHTHSNYAAFGSDVTVTGMWTFNTSAGGNTVPFTLNSAMTSVVTYLNADKLDGNDASAFALAGHTHGDDYYTEDEIDTFLALKLAVPTGATVNPLAPITAYIDDVLKTTNVSLGDLALQTDLAAKYDEVAGVNGNFPAFATSGTTLADSGYAPGDFAAAGHTHDDRYFTETEMGNGSISPTFNAVGINGNLVLTETVTAGAATGTLTNCVVAGDPAVYFSIFIGTTEYAVPGWLIP